MLRRDGVTSSGSGRRYCVGSGGRVMGTELSVLAGPRRESAQSRESGRRAGARPHASSPPCTALAFPGRGATRALRTQIWGPGRRVVMGLQWAWVPRMCSPFLVATPGCLTQGILTPPTHLLKLFTDLSLFGSDKQN